MPSIGSAPAHRTAAPETPQPYIYNKVETTNGGRLSDTREDVPTNDGRLAEARQTLKYNRC